MPQPCKVMARGKDDAPLLAPVDAGRGAAMPRRAALAHLDKDHRAVGRAHDEVDLAATPPRRPIIAREQAQSRSLQMGQGQVFGDRAPLPRRRARRAGSIAKELH